MFCNKCGEQIPDESGFCNKCGSPQKDEPVRESATAPRPREQPQLQPPVPLAHGESEPERDLWKGRFSGKSMAHWWALWGLWMIVMTYVYLGPLKEWRSEKSWVFYVYLALVGVPVLWILWTTMVRKLTVRYRLTTDRLFREIGFISRKINELELIRVDDVSVSQNIFQRIFNVGKVTVISTDSSDPRLEIIGIDNPIEVKETIRTHVRKRRDRALHMESL